MSARKTESQFLCDACGAKVGFKETRCPRCGKFFNAVRCPVCNFTGENSQFRFGCPSCGYAVGSENQYSEKKSKKKRLPRLKDPFPSWVYYISLPILVILIIVFGVLLFSR